MNKYIALLVCCFWAAFESQSLLADGIEFNHDKSFQEVLNMAKSQNSKKQTKKTAKKSPAEKRLAKRAKKSGK